METEQHSQPPFTREYILKTYTYKDGELFLKDGKKAHGLPSYTKGYAKISILGKRYGLHRVIYFYHSGLWGNTKNHIDHIDGNTYNNKIENLQLIPASANIRKAAKRKNNTTGVTGVCWHKGAKKYTATLKDNYKSIYLGLFVDIQEAQAALLKAYESLEKRYKIETI